MYVFVSELCVLGDIRQFLLAYCINIILYMDVRMRQALEAFAQGKLSVDNLLALARRIAEDAGRGSLASPK